MSQFNAIQEHYDDLERAVCSFDALTHDSSDWHGPWYAIYEKSKRLQNFYEHVVLTDRSIDPGTRTKVINLLQQAHDTIPRDTWTHRLLDLMKAKTTAVIQLPTVLLKPDNDIIEDDDL